ncbi:MAG: GNAT family N-acetyltransferase [Chloroflexota bacterium]
MPEIEIRPAIASDIPSLVELDHHYTSDHVWQIEMRRGSPTSLVSEPVRSVHFRQMRLPRSARVEYPRPPKALIEDWNSRSGVLVALLDQQPIGYASLSLQVVPISAWVSDLVVDRPLRRKGIGRALLLAATEWATQEWVTQMGKQNLILEMQPKNHPAIQLALKLGFELCGYNDRYYANHDAAIFFGKSLF